MIQSELREMLEKLAAGKISVDDAILAVKKAPFEELGYAKVDLHRGLRKRAAEVIYGAGKKSEQIAGIIRSLKMSGDKNILVTRMDAQAASEVQMLIEWPLQYFADARIGVIGERPMPDGMGKIIVATAGTTDIPVAEEAAITAEYLGNQVERIFDIGIAGLHRILGKLDQLMTARVIIAVAGMEGALPSVLAGLVDCPVIAVPTSVGYGASFHGVAALLSMLNSCASGVSVVNIDNGFGAAFQASLINHITAENHS